MSIFKHTLHTLHTLERERDPQRIAKAQRLHTLLAHDLRYADLPNFKSKLASLSPVPIEIKTAILPKAKKGLNFSPKAAMIAAALRGFHVSDFSDPAKRANYRVLRQLQLQGLEQVAKRGGQKKVSPVGADTRRYNPTFRSPRTIHGTIAALNVSHSLLPHFSRPAQVVPCIRRKVRKQVMFALGAAGRGYRVKHRRNQHSGVPC